MSESSGREINLAGNAALAWFGARGMESVPVPGLPPRLSADFFRDRALGVTRIWHTPLVVEMQARTGSTASVTLVLVLDGDLDVSIDGETMCLQKKQAVLLDQRSSLTFRNDRPSARVEIQFSPRELVNPYLVNAMAYGDALERSGMSEVLAGLVNVVFTAGVSPGDTGWPHVSRAIMEVVSAMLTTAAWRPMAPRASSANVRLFHRAVDMIHEQYARVELSVGVLCRQLGTSPPRLREAFRVHGTTARDVIRASRTAHAARLWEAGNFTSKEDLEHIARSAGFPSARAMAEAMKRVA